MTTVNKALCQAVRNDMNAALAALTEKHGLQFTVGNMKYTELGIEIKCEARVVGAESKELADLKSFMVSLRLKDEHLTREFGLDGELFTLAGYKTRSRTRPMLIKRVCDGKEFVCSVQDVHRALGIN